MAIVEEYEDASINWLNYIVIVSFLALLILNLFALNKKANRTLFAVVIVTGASIALSLRIGFCFAIIEWDEAKLISYFY